MGGRTPFAGAVAGATLAALVVGIGEALVVSVERHLGIDTGLLFFAILFYGLTGVVAGIAFGVALPLIGARRGGSAYALAGALTFSALVTVIGRFRVFRDVLHETFDGQAISPLAFQLGSLVVALVLAALAFAVLRAVGRREGAATSLVTALGILVVGVGVSGGTMLVRGAPPSVAHSPLASRGTAHGPSVILVMVDTLRADHLSCYGYDAIRTPAIDALAADGTRFAHAYAQASWTRPSVATILTSLYPSSHKAIHKSDILPDAVTTLPEVLQAAGYRTIGFANNINVAPLFNFQQGFDEYYFLEPAFFFGATESAAQLTLYNQLRLIRERYLSRVKHVENYYQPAEIVTERGSRWIADRPADGPFFMFLHYMDAHDPYFTHPWNGEALARVANPNPSCALAERYRAAYDGAIVYLDEQIGRLVAGLKARGMYDDTMIVLTADHGEEFCEHGGWWHGQTLYDEQLAVPLIVKAPRGGPAGVVNDAMVASLDIAPTIIAAAGAQAPAAMVGRPLSLAAGAPAPRDHAFAESDLEGNVLQAYRGEGWKFIQANPGNPRGLPIRQLFEVAGDPGEHHDLAASRQDEVATLATRLATVQSRALARAVDGSETAIDSATEERLRALGYVN
ncbi:MAG: sulfatase [Deltaproteobacteria bacterium]|nr:sulfatase [Deltaproteobacteria bacterium]